MIDRAATLIDEIRQLKIQYVNEVGSGRRAWPRSIKERVFELGDLGIPAKAIGEKTGVPAETVNSWRFQRRHGVDKRFHVLAVKPELPEIAKTGTVTVTDKMPKNPYSILVTLPDGIRDNRLRAESKRWVVFLDRKGLRVFIYRDEIDMRCGFEKLHSYCVHQMNAVMDQGHVYLFFGKNRKRMKILVYDGSGLVLIAKRIERGRFMAHAELMGRNEITHEELKLLLHGSVIRRPILDRSMGNISTQRESVALPSGQIHL